MASTATLSRSVLIFFRLSKSPVCMYAADYSLAYVLSRAREKIVPVKKTCVILAASSTFSFNNCETSETDFVKSIPLTRLSLGSA